jgi:hypothetical protein
MKNMNLFDSYEDFEDSIDAEEGIQDAIDQADIEGSNTEFEDDDNLETYTEDSYDDEEDGEFEFTSQGF